MIGHACFVYKIRVGRKNGIEAMIDSGASVNCMDK